MKTCKECGFNMPLHAAQCPICGAKSSPANGINESPQNISSAYQVIDERTQSGASVPANTRMVCPHCNADIPAVVDNCPYCFNRVNTHKSAASQRVANNTNYYNYGYQTSYTIGQSRKNETSDLKIIKLNALKIFGILLIINAALTSINYDIRFFETFDLDYIEHYYDSLFYYSSMSMMSVGKILIAAFFFTCCKKPVQSLLTAGLFILTFAPFTSSYFSITQVIFGILFLIISIFAATGFRNANGAKKLCMATAIIGMLFNCILPIVQEILIREYTMDSIDKFYQLFYNSPYCNDIILLVGLVVYLSSEKLSAVKTNTDMQQGNSDSYGGAAANNTLNYEMLLSNLESEYCKGIITAEEYKRRRELVLNNAKMKTTVPEYSSVSNVGGYGTDYQVQSKNNAFDTDNNVPRGASAYNVPSNNYSQNYVKRANDGFSAAQPNNDAAVQDAGQTEVLSSSQNDFYGSANSGSSGNSGGNFQY